MGRSARSSRPLSLQESRNSGPLSLWERGRVRAGRQGRRTKSPSALTLTLSQRERGQLLPTAYRPPLYPLLLTGCVALGDYSRAAVAVLHLMMGMATVGLVLVLGRWWGLGSRGAALAALLVACDPILLSQSTQVMTETPAALLATAGLVTLTWASRNPSVFRAMLAGATLALGALCRPTLLPGQSWRLAMGTCSSLAGG